MKHFKVAKNSIDPNKYHLVKAFSVIKFYSCNISLLKYSPKFGSKSCPWGVKRIWDFISKIFLKSNIRYLVKFKIGNQIFFFFVTSMF